MALLMVRNLIQNGHQDGRHLGFYLKFIFIGKMLKLPLVVFSRVVYSEGPECGFLECIE